MNTEARICGLQDKNSYDCNGRMSKVCEDCNMIIETVIDLPECRICEEKYCIQAGEVVREVRTDNTRRMADYQGNLDNCGYRRYKLEKQNEN